MTSAQNDVWPIVHAERRRLVADLRGLPIARWRTPSLCPGWDVHDVLAHLVDTARTGRLMFVRELLRARFSFDRANDTGVAREKRADPQDTVRALKSTVADVVEGAGIDLLLAVSGRSVPAERFAGAGAARLLDAAS